MTSPGQTNLGVLAFGDSITNGGGELQWGVALQSWALWLARGLGLPYTAYAFDGATVHDVLEVQIPRLQTTNAQPRARYDVGCLYIGVNDLRALDWDLADFEDRQRRALDFLAARCDRVLAVTAPLDLGRPRAGERVLECNGAIERNAAAAGVLLLDLHDFGARNMVMPDHVHPTAFGQIAIAERALAVLASDGLPTRLVPRSLILFEENRHGRLRGDLTYVYRRTRVTGDALLKRAIGALTTRR
ncbi:MAG: SGNH/GDSL hydrolase family protein [Solirubrobacteraceae bacterium]